MTERELAWAAGIIEGEGHIRVNTPTKRNRGALMVSVANTDIEIVTFFIERWGGCLKPIAKKEERHAQGYAWNIAATVAAGFLREILPYLRTNRRRRLARLALRFQQQKSKRTSLNRTPDYLRRQMWYYQAFRRLNEQGENRYLATHCPNAPQHRRKR